MILRSTDNAVSFIFRQILLRLSSAGYFDHQYQIFKLITESAPLLYHCTNDTNLHELQQCVLRTGDEGIIELCRWNLASTFDA